MKLLLIALFAFMQFSAYCGPLTDIANSNVVKSVNAAPIPVTNINWQTVFQLITNRIIAGTGCSISITPSNMTITVTGGGGGGGGSQSPLTNDVDAAQFGITNANRYQIRNTNAPSGSQIVETWISDYGSGGVGFMTDGGSSVYQPIYTFDQNGYVNFSQTFYGAFDGGVTVEGNLQSGGHDGLFNFSFLKFDSLWPTMELQSTSATVGDNTTTFRQGGDDTTVTLPAPASYQYRMLFVKFTGTTSCTVTEGDGNIEGGGVTLNPGECLQVHSDGDKWWILNKYVP